MIVWGGYTGAGNYGSDGGRFNPITNQWIPLSLTNAPSSRSGPVAVWNGTEMIVWGGNNGNTPLGDGGRFNPATNVWTTVASSNAVARYYHTAVWAGNQMILFGGYTGSTDLNDTWNYRTFTLYLYQHP